MRGKRLSERTMGHAKLEMLVDYYLADMQRRGCSGDSVGMNRRDIRRFAERPGGWHLAGHVVHRGGDRHHRRLMRHDRQGTLGERLASADRSTRGLEHAGTHRMAIGTSACDLTAWLGL
jgi:hypothetical protein